MADPLGYYNALTNVLRGARDIRDSVAETALTMGSGMGASAIGGLGALGEMVDPSTRSFADRLKRGVAKIEDAQERFTYRPRTEMGERSLQNVGGLIDTVTKPVMEKVVDPIGERYPVVGAGIVTAASMIGPKGAKGAKLKPGVPKVTQEALAQQVRALDTRIAARRGELMEIAPDDIRRQAGEQGLQRMLEERERLSVQHNAMYDRMMRDVPNYDPGTNQQLIPGLDPLTPEQMHGRAMDRLREAQGAMSFDDLNRGTRFEYDPEWTGSALGSLERQPGAWEHSFIDPNSERVVGKRQVNEIRGGRYFRRDLEDPHGSGTPDAFDSSLHGNTPQERVGHENFQQMLERLTRLREAETEAMTRGEEVAVERARAMNDRIRRKRALLNEPRLDAEREATLHEGILDAMRNRPVSIEGRTLMPMPGEGLYNNITWRDLLGRAETPPANYLTELPQQEAVVRRLRGLPDMERPIRRAPEGGRTVPEVEGRDPNAMNRESVDAFLKQSQTSEPLFQYGLMPGPEVRSLEDFARHFGRKANEPIDVDWSYGSNVDEPMKIEVEKRHGRGEVMRDQYGDYIDRQKTHEPGDYPMYDERGDVKKVELPGPMPKGEEGPLLGKKIAEGGEIKRDEYGDPQYEFKKSEGGELVRDERGRVKKKLKDNPEYGGGEEDRATLTGPAGEIEIQYGHPEAFITSTGASANKAKAAKGAGGQLLYQTALAHASREGVNIGTGSLTDVNRYRLLSNVLSNIARSGVNPRDVRGTASGMAARATGRARGPEVWRAEAEEARSRLRGAGIDPDRVRFDPDSGFSIDGKPASPDDIKLNMRELSPLAGAHDSLGGVGQKSLMRNAVFEWLRHATPEQAKAVAAKWPKGWGPIFAGIGALSVLPALKQEEDITAD